MVLSKIKEVTELIRGVNNSEGDNNTGNRIDYLQEEISLNLELLPDIDFFSDMPLVYDPDVFFESSLLTVKNAILSQQSQIFPHRSLRKDTVNRELCELKKKL